MTRNIELNPSRLETQNTQVRTSLHEKTRMSVLFMLKKQTDKIIVQKNKISSRQDEIQVLQSVLKDLKSQKKKDESESMSLNLDVKNGEAIENALKKVKLFDSLEIEKRVMKPQRNANPFIVQHVIIDNNKNSRGKAEVDDAWIKKLEATIVKHSQPIEEEQIILKEAISHYDKIDRVGVKILKMSHDINMGIARNISI